MKASIHQQRMMHYGPSYGPSCVSTGITHPPFGLNATSAAGAKTTGEDPTPDCIAIIRDAAIDASLDDTDDMEGLVQISQASTIPYNQHTVKLVKRLAKNKDKGIDKSIIFLITSPKTPSGYDLSQYFFV